MSFHHDISSLATDLQRIVGELRDLASMEGIEQDASTEDTLWRIQQDLQKRTRELQDVSRNVNRNLAQNRPRRPSGWGGD